MKLSERFFSFFTGKRSGGSTHVGSADAHRNLDHQLVYKLADRRVPTVRQLKHLPRFLSTKEKGVIRAVVGVLLIAVAAVGLKYLTDHVSTVAATGGEYVEASVGTPRFLNPVLASTNDADLDLMKLVFTGLMKTATNGELVTDLAESYTASDDGKTYTFILRNDVTWHDGVPFTASDVVFTVNAIKDSAWKSPLMTQFKNVTAEAVDERTVVFTLAESFAPFVSTLTVGIIPEHVWQEVRPENASRAELNIKPVGTGPFKFKSFAKDKRGAVLSYSIARYDSYYGDRSHLAGVTFKYYPDFSSAEEALAARKVDGMSFLPLEYREAAEKQRNVRFYTLQLPQYTAVFFNQKKNAALGSKAVRQALALSIDREAVLNTSLGSESGVLVHSPILAGFVGFYPEVKKYAFNQQEAAGMLEKDGWKVDTDGIRKKDGKDDKGAAIKTPLTITLTTADSKENIAAADRIKQDWDGIGVQTTLEIVPASKIQKEKIRPRAYDALLYGEILGTDPDPFPFWHSSQGDASGLNLAVFNNRRADELLEKARQATKTEERETMYKEFQDILAEEVPAVFLYSPKYTYVVSRKVRGIEPATIFTPADRFATIASWYIETKRIWQQ